MEAIKPGSNGAAVEDVQHRLTTLGARIAQAELDAQKFGASTTAAVRAFRCQHGLPMGDEIDEVAWIVLVDETYRMGDRTLYLRLPYFHGADVSHLQMTLNVLGFSCGAVDGFYGPHTEAAVREFQANMGLMADGMAFQDTFDAIDRLHHVWQGKTVNPEFVNGHMGFARAVEVLESNSVVIGATDPIARNVASRIWNVAYATTSDAKVTLTDALANGEFHDASKADIAIILATAPLEAGETLPAGTLNIVVQSGTPVAAQLHAALAAQPSRPDTIRLELAELNRYDGSVTARMVQNAAIDVVDALCEALG
jgi:peptidoglycan hydrolase-like protein with peptidoglycan-binding domain